MQKVDLCEKCSKEKGVSNPTGFAIADMLLGTAAPEEMKATAAENLTCPQCGFTQPDFKKTGRLGCPQCYGTFSDGLNSILKDMHKGTIHKGKIPARIALAQAFESRLKALHTDLLNAVKAEDYEHAAALRDEITSLEATRKY